MSSYLEHVSAYWGYGGLLLFPIALVSLGIWNCFLRSREVHARALRDCSALCAGWDRMEQPSSQDSLEAFLQSFPGAVADLIKGAMRDVQNGTEPLLAFYHREEEGLRQLRHDFLLLSAFTAVAPLLGLLGTVMGMIDTFDAVSVLSGQTGSRVASGISKALITTQFGLVVAVPGIFGLARLHRLHRNVQVELASCRTRILSVLEATAG